MCADIAYNETIFPNLMGQLTQDIAGQHMSQYVPLIKGRPGSNCLNAKNPLKIHTFIAVTLLLKYFAS